ncbi:MAG: prepilin peptidase [bacterium]|nr:prepilin peptidase [bacterium]
MLDIFFSIFVFIFGLIVGSFLNCLVYRLEQNKTKSLLKGRSFCPKCKHQLKFRDLIPVFSFLFLRGKCRYCSKKISWQYPAIEVATGLTFFLIFNFQFSIFNQFSIYQFLNFLCLLGAFSCLIVIFVYDLKHYIIPDKILLPFAVLIVLSRAFEYFFNVILLKRDLGMSASSLHWHWVFALATLAFFFLIWFFSKGKAMGFGDVKLIFPLTLMLGWPLGAVGLFIAFLSGSVVGIVLMIAGINKISSQVPFGPFLIGGAFIAFLWGNTLWLWYLKLIFNS